MALAFDAYTKSAQFLEDLYPSPYTFTHTPVGTPRGVIVMVVCFPTDGGVDLVSGVTYGGVAMTRIQAAWDTATEEGCAYLYFLGSGIPTGAQTVAIQEVDNGVVFPKKVAVAVTVTAATTTTVVAASAKVENDTANPSATLTANGASGMAFAAMFSGLGSAATAAAGCTMIDSHNYDSAGLRYADWVRVTSASTSNQTVGFTSASDDVGFVAALITEAATTSASGGNATGTGASYVAGPTVKAGALIASEVATASQGDGSDLLLEVQNAATATGAAYTGTPKPQPSAGVGTATGIAFQIPLGAAIGNAAATGSALTTGATVKPAAGAGSATGAASSAVPSLSPSAGLASPVAFGAAYQPTVDRATYAVAGVASATGGASGASETVKPSAGQATATQTTYGPGVVSDSATVVASGAALAQAEAVAVFATIGATTGYGSGSGAALDATVTTGITVSAESALATAAALVARAGSFTGPSQGSGPRGRSPHHRPHVVIR